MKGFISLSRARFAKSQSDDDMLKFLQLTKSSGFTGYVYHNKHYILQYIEGNKKGIEKHMDTIHKNTKTVTLSASSRNIAYLRFTNLSIDDLGSVTAAEKMFYEKMVDKLKKINKKNGWCIGVPLSYFYYKTLWKLVDQLSHIYAYLLPMS